jgi:hypothetical protein
MTSESEKRSVVFESDPAIRNPFRVMDVPNPNDDEVTQFARNTVPEESTADENAEITVPWVGLMVSDQRIDGYFTQGRVDFRR